MTDGSSNIELLTLGHSTHPIERFIALLKGAGATAVADVRSSPYSRYSPQYSKDALRSALSEAGIAYTFLGKEFGARSTDPSCYRNGKVQYSKLTQSAPFADGVQRVFEGLKKYRIAFVCAERDPIECHRALLVARTFSDRGTSVSHIHSDGMLESHPNLESRLLAAWKLPEGDMFKTRESFIKEAYLLQGDRVAYQDEQMLKTEVTAE
jgi:uncharacterized protein (DUF488 family)